jgi:two-component system response regulator ResD
MARILVVEDDDAIRQLVHKVLGMAGHDVEEAATGDEAIKRLVEDKFALVVLDLMLGAVSGWDVLEEAGRRGVRDRFKVLMLTARRSERDFLHGWRMGVDAYLTKPFEVEALTEAVRDTLQKSPEQLAMRRKEELEKAELLYRLESAFQRW